MVERLRYREIPKRLLITNALVTGIYTVGVLAANYSAIITDQALRGNRPYGDVKALVVLLITTKLIGTILGQLLFLPAAQVIASFYGS